MGNSTLGTSGAPPHNPYLFFHICENEGVLAEAILNQHPLSWNKFISLYQLMLTTLHDIIIMIPSYS